MEHKIGEIFEYNCEWYQTVKSQGKCCSCDFMIDGHCIVDFSSNGSCFYCHRKDKENVVFKKLEKVGEPYEYFIQGMGIIMVQEYILANADYIWEYSQDAVVMDCQNGKVAIEIKQNKEDMEEKNNGNTPLNVLTDKYVNGYICYDDFEKEVKALYSCKEEIKPTLKEFDLEAAKAGKPVCTRDGRKARIICFDKQKDLYPIIALAKDNEGYETIYQYSKKGISSVCGKPTDNDLMMLPEKKEGWVNVYMEETNNNERLIEQVIYKTRKDAFDNACPRGYKATVKIEWEE